MDIGTGIATGCGCFSAAIVVIKVFGRGDKGQDHTSPQCAVHSVVVENLKETMAEIKDRLDKIEVQLAKALTGMVQ